MYNGEKKEDFSDRDWRENKKVIFQSLEIASQGVDKNAKEVQTIKLHLQKIEGNTEIIKAWMKSERVQEQEQIKKTPNKILIPIIVALISSGTTIVGITLSGLMDLIK